MAHVDDVAEDAGQIQESDVAEGEEEGDASQRTAPAHRETDVSEDTAPAEEADVAEDASPVEYSSVAE